MTRAKRQEKRLMKLKKNKRVVNPFALENWLETHERRKRLRRRKRG